MLVTEITAQSIDEALRAQLASLEMGVDSREVGTVIQVGDGIARVDGLKNAMAGELLEFIGEGGKTVYGLAQNLEEDEVGAVILGDNSAIKENDAVRTTGRIVEVPSGKGMIGRVVNPLGEPLDGRGPISEQIFYPVEKIMESQWAFTLKLNPVYCSIDIFRGGVLGYMAPSWDYMYAAGFGVVALLIGIILFKWKQDDFILYL